MSELPSFMRNLIGAIKHVKMDQMIYNHAVNMLTQLTFQFLANFHRDILSNIRKMSSPYFNGPARDIHQSVAGEQSNVHDAAIFFNRFRKHGVPLLEILGHGFIQLVIEKITINIAGKGYFHTTIIIHHAEILSIPSLKVSSFRWAVHLADYIITRTATL
jgi:hypothetical protein